MRNFSPVNVGEKGARRHVKIAPRELISFVRLVVALATGAILLLQLKDVRGKKLLTFRIFLNFYRNEISLSVFEKPKKNWGSPCYFCS